MPRFGYAVGRILDALVNIFLVMIFGFFLFYWGRIWQDTSDLSLLPAALASYARLIFLEGFGVSWRYESPTLEVIAGRVPYTVLLLGVAVVASVLIGTVAGLIAGSRKNTTIDRMLAVVLVVPFAIPTAYLCRTFLYWLCYKLALFPLGRSFSDQWIYDPNFPPQNLGASLMLAFEFGALLLGLAFILSRGLKGKPGSRREIFIRPAAYTSAALLWSYLMILMLPYEVAGYALDVLWHLFMPCVLLVLAMLYLFFLTARNSAVTVLAEDYILTAKAKGLRRSAVLIKHAFRNSMLPTIALVAQSFTIIIGLEAIVEIIFSWHGMGMLIYNAVYLRTFLPVDYPVLLSLLFVFAAVVTIGNALSDIAAHYLDPRLRRAREVEVQ